MFQGPWRGRIRGEDGEEVHLAFGFAARQRPFRGRWWEVFLAQAGRVIDEPTVAGGVRVG